MFLGHGKVLQLCFSQRSGVRGFQHFPAPIVGGTFCATMLIWDKDTTSPRLTATSTLSSALTPWTPVFHHAVDGALNSGAVSVNLNWGTGRTVLAFFSCVGPSL